MIYDKFIPSPALHLLEREKKYFYIEFKLRNNNEIEIERNIVLERKTSRADSVMDVELRIEHMYEEVTLITFEAFRLLTVI